MTRKSKVGANRQDDSTPDHLVWRKVVENVRPLQQETALPPAPVVITSPTLPPSPPPLPLPVAEKSTKPRLSALSHGDVQPLDKRTGKKFKDGRLPIEARLDLHGMGEARACEALRRFIQDAHASGLRCVLVVTGKGRQSEGGFGIIRTRTPDWLNGADLRPLILSFSHARPKDGGAGALYILLKRHRS
ncbi:MAG: hypothetical protein A2516_07805 [Alphaproteobacteria bacterium RIFOXYD12_FULL_60_8]|nr:MAG: hypothetical protein A2516_07805 [Alphaproteobacteria bacterium RIFOXYD12_FULL_60_8]